MQMCHSYNNYGQEAPKDGFQNLTSIINREMAHNKASSNAVSSISLSALSALSSMNTNTASII